MKLQFRKGSVERQEIIDTLEAILAELRQSVTAASPAGGLASSPPANCATTTGASRRAAASR